MLISGSPRYFVYKRLFTFCGEDCRVLHLPSQKKYLNGRDNAITMASYTFIKESSGWYIDLPEYIEQGGNKGDLAMVEGADTMLDIMSGGNPVITLEIK